MSPGQPPSGFLSHSGRKQFLLWIWVSPGTILGLMIGGLGLCTGGACRRVGPTLEFWGGVVTKLLESRMLSALGMTLGHVVIGVSATALDRVRAHEWVHIRQYERWGPLFIPAYLARSANLYLQGRDGYLDNPFEIEARQERDPLSG
jgi:hypothetical protein